MPQPTQSPQDIPVQMPATAPMAIGLLKADHTTAAMLFDAYLAAKADSNPLLKRGLAVQICAELTVHATIEEEIFYPAARAALGDEGDMLVEEAKEEHAEVKALIAELDAALDVLPLPAKTDALVKKISAAVLAHVEEEETVLFPMVEATELDLADVGLVLNARKQELKNLISKAGRPPVTALAKVPT